jgi:hypothetical protein
MPINIPDKAGNIEASMVYVSYTSEKVGDTLTAQNSTTGQGLETF